MESVGERIKKRRKELQLTQTDIFEKCGIRSGSLSRIENGSVVPSITMFYIIAQALECDMTWLLTGSSSDIENCHICKNEELLLNMFRELDHDDQEELIDIVEIKLKRKKKGSGAAAKSSPYTEGGSGDMVG